MGELWLHLWNIITIAALAAMGRKTRTAIENILESGLLSCHKSPMRRHLIVTKYVLIVQLTQHEMCPSD